MVIAVQISVVSGNTVIGGNQHPTGIGSILDLCTDARAIEHHTLVGIPEVTQEIHIRPCFSLVITILHGQEIGGQHVEQGIFVEHTLVHIHICGLLNQPSALKADMILFLRQIGTVFHDPVIAVHGVVGGNTVYIIINDSVFTDGVVVCSAGIAVLIEFDVLFAIDLLESRPRLTIIEPLAIGIGVSKEE